ncbi:MAG: hypothetical protein UY10_C0059G0004 [Microgenomates group bacterium GW2011_GWA2_47_8]|nr:MAG: hypothetical protein UY10_C0059G0004 [Microgenomates group bacterium GW2011_GWA2_47_8]
MGYIKALSITKNSRQTVYLVSDLSQQVAGYSGAKLYSALKYAAKKKDLNRITRGIYAFSKDYSRIEFANKFRTPSYISLYTILQEAQRSEVYEIDGQKYMYRKIQDDILLNHVGTIFVDGVHKATPERALCDTLYLDGDAFFDNLRDINWELMKNLNTDVYGNNKVIAGFIKKFAGK